MNLQVLATGAMGLVAIIFWYLAYRKRHLQANSCEQVVQIQVTSADPAVCARIIACTGYDNTGAKNLYSDVESRAIPNQRLVRAFGIDNSFTTREAQRRKDFNKEAVRRIKMTETQWQEVARYAQELVRQAVSPSNLTTVGQTESVTLDSLVRSVCLKIVLHVLFNLDPLEMDCGNILTITESINTLWIQSKGTGLPVESDKHGLLEALAGILPKWDRSKPHENPLNMIIPAYETLWRVVLSGFVQVTFVKGGSPSLRYILAHFLANPTVTARKEIGHGPEASAVSVEHIVKEALRLYPSVKRVYRQFHMDNAAEPVDVTADIKAYQRTKAIWGADAERFIPSRWVNTSDGARTTYMNFGVHPFVCPAKAEFGPMMIGILVAAFTDNLSSEDWDLRLGEKSSDAAQCDFDKALSGEQPLESDRSTYEGIRIMKK